VNATPWPDVLDLHHYWEERPPAHVALSHLLIWYGAKQPRGTTALSDAENRMMNEGNVIPFKRLPKHALEFVKELAQKPDKVG